MLEPDRIEPLNNSRSEEVSSEQFTRRRFTIVQHRDLAVTVRVIIVRIDYDLSFPAIDRKVRILAQRNRYENDIAEITRRFHRSCGRIVAKFLGESVERFGPA